MSENSSPPLTARELSELLERAELFFSLEAIQADIDENPKREEACKQRAKDASAMANFLWENGWPKPAEPPDAAQQPSAKAENFSNAPARSANTSPKLGMRNYLCTVQIFNPNEVVCINFVCPDFEEEEFRMRLLKDRFALKTGLITRTFPVPARFNS